MNAKGPRTLQTILCLVIGIFGVVVLIVGIFTISAIAGEAPSYDLDFVGASATINGAIFVQYDPSDSAGTGLFKPFLQIDASPSEKGYNTEGDLQFDTKGGTSGNTRGILLSDFPMVMTGGDWYRELQIDVNESGIGNLIDLTEFQIFTAITDTLDVYHSPTISPFPPYPPYIDTGPGSTISTTLVYDMDAGTYDSIAHLAYLQAGGGDADYLVLIPDAIFGAGPGCDFGGTDCSKYVYLYANFGEDTPSIPPRGSDDGFEEIAVSEGTARLNPPEFEVTKWVYNYDTNQFDVTPGWVFSATVTVSDTTDLPDPDKYYWLNPSIGSAGGPDNLGTTLSGTTTISGTDQLLWSWIPGELTLPKWSWNSELSFYEVPQGGLVFVGAQCTRTYKDGTISYQKSHS